MTCPSCKRRIRLRKSREMICKCGYVFNYSEYFGKGRVFLVDANVIIYALEEKGECGSYCRRVLSRSDVATTRRVLEEVQTVELDYSLRVFEVKSISGELRELRATGLKQPSEADLSLVQAALDHPEVGGIVTYDRDFERIAAAGLVQLKSSGFSSRFWVGNAEEFLEKHRMES